jgi:hypothetical protein
MMMYNLIKLFIYLFALAYIVLVIAPLVIITTLITNIFIWIRKKR